MKFGFLAIARSVGVAACLFALSSVSQAGYITSVSGSGTGWSLAGGSVVPTTNDANGAYTLAKETGNSLTLNLTALQLQSPFTLTFNTTSEAGWDFRSRIYDVTLNITRSLTTPNASHATMNGVDFAFGSNSTVALPLSIVTNVAGMGANFSPGIFAFQQPNPTTGNLNITGWRFGGLNGGGAGLTQTGLSSSTTVKFQLLLFQQSGVGAQSSTYLLTANPEPTTLLLGSLVMVPAGIAIRRRRKAAAAAEAAV